MAPKTNFPILFFSGIGLLFAACSSVLIIRVNAIRQTVETHVAIINTLSRLEAETFSVLNTIEENAGTEVLKKINSLTAFPDVPADVIDFSNLKVAARENDEDGNKQRIADELFLIKKSCQYVIGENRQQLRSNSEKLLHYWNYTHALLILASIMFLALPFIIYSVTKRRHNPLQ